MKDKKGFTMVELLVCLAIIGILSATAIPAFQTFRQRARGQEAILMSRQIIEGQILYYLEHNSFFPEGTSDLWIPDGANTEENTRKVKEALNIEIPEGHLTYQFESYVMDDKNQFMLTVSGEYILFKDGAKDLWATVNEDGETVWWTIAGTL